MVMIVFLGNIFISSDIILNCFEKEDAYFFLKKDGFKELSRESVMLAVYNVLLPGTNFY